MTPVPRATADPWLEDEIRRFAPQTAIEEAWLPPSSWYTDPRFYDLERATVFRSNWLVAARRDELLGPGAYAAGVMAGEPYVVVRGSDNALRAFYNVCRHHAAQVVGGAGCAEALVCPYHGWTYGLDGRLLRAPELGAARGFDRAQFGLAPMQVSEWGDLAFIALSEPTRRMEDDLAELAARLRDKDDGPLRFVARRKYALACNWKVYVDNYLDGGYHVAHLHRGLARQLDLDTYRTEIFARYSIQSGVGAGATTNAESTPTTDFAARIGDRVLYAWIYPNLMINRYGPMMDTNWVVPRSHDQTDVIFDYYFTEKAASDAEFVAKSLAASDAVQKEDTGICESVQQGLRSASYDRGRYSALREHGEFHFHHLLAQDFQTRLKS